MREKKRNETRRLRRWEFNSKFFLFLFFGHRKSQLKEATPKKPKIYEDDDDGSMCPICLDNWDTDGAHRLVSLKCGHLFGDSCIRR